MRVIATIQKRNAIFTALAFFMLIGFCFAAFPPGAICLGNPTTITQETPDMAVYCTIDDLKNSIPETTLIRLTDDSGAGAIDTTKANQAIAEAAQEMDLYIGKKYALPITGTVPPILKPLNADLAIYKLYARYKEDIPETRMEQRKNAIGLLTAIRDGKISLGLQPPPSPPTAEQYTDRSRVSARTKDFDSDTMAKY